MGYPIYHSAYTAAQIEASIGKGPRVNTSGYWEVWNVATMAYESTGVGAGVTPPTVVTQASQMTNHGYIYIYNGSETGYTAGYWYYWDGSAWTAGGAYQVAATDPTLSVAGAAADAKACGDLKSALTLDKKGEESLESYGIFVNGSLSGGNVTIGTNTYRVATDTKIVFDRDITLKAATGFKFLLNIFAADESYTSSGWQTDKLFVKQGTRFKIVIARVTEDSSEVANVPYFVNQVTFNTALGDKAENNSFILQHTVEEAPVTKFYSGATKYGGYCNTSGGLSPNANYETYMIPIPESCDIWFKDYDLWSPSPDTIVCVYKASNISSDNLVGTRMRYDGSTNTIPKESNKLSVTAGQYIAVSINVGRNFKMYGTQLVNTLNNDAKDKHENYFYYSSSANVSEKYTESVHVYLWKTKRYVEYLFVHSVDNNTNASVWRIHKANALDGYMTSGKGITEHGEWECAIKLSGRQDYMGGILHGDEVVDDITFILDGRIVNISSYTDLTAFTSLEVAQTSTLYDPGTSDSDPNKGDTVATHNSIHKWADEKLIISQSVKWISAQTLADSYLAMFPVSKSAVTNLIVNSDATNLTFTTYPVNKADTNDAILIGSDLFAEFSIKKYPLGQDDGTLFNVTDNGGQPYNKCYYYVTKPGDGTEVSNGDIWVSESEYMIY